MSAIASSLTRTGPANGRVPFALATRLDTAPVSRNAVDHLTAPFLATTLAGRYRGPAWVGDDGIACVVLVAMDDRWPRKLRSLQGCGLILWCWETSPTIYLSVSVVASTRDAPSSPIPRWMGIKQGPVAEAIYQHGRFRCIVAAPGGQNSGWLEAVCRDSALPDSPPGREMLEYIWSLPPAGVAGSDVRRRHEPDDLKPPETTPQEVQLPVPAEPEADFWRTLGVQGPWTQELRALDKAKAAWGNAEFKHRAAEASFVHALAQRPTGPLFTRQGTLANTTSPLRVRFDAMVTKYPLIGTWLAAIGGPEACPAAAHGAAAELFAEPAAVWGVLDELMGLLVELDDYQLSRALQSSTTAAMLSPAMTRSGELRPSLRNLPPRRLKVIATPFDLAAPIEDIDRMWSSWEPAEMLDAADWLAGTDFPTSLKEVSERLAGTSLQGTCEQAYARVIELLEEAQAARQWSIPWGARVEINVGPFVGVRIHEHSEGEFLCLFLDEQERFFTVAVGIATSPPRARSNHIGRPAERVEDAAWNEDAELTLQLIAAAIVRDFLVVEEREALFTARPLRKRVRGREVRTIVYLPRVRYDRPLARPETETPGPAHAGPQRHPVAEHLRRAGRAAPEQRLLALRYGIRLPEGFTFVRPHHRGGETEERRLRVYRSRSASRMLFEEVDRAPGGSRPLWFDFEKDCARLLAGRGMRVVHQAAHRAGDGGVDLYAIDTAGQTWVAQCKCWAPHRLVGPDVVRELQGAITLAQGSGQVPRGIVITTSGFTPGAVSAAKQLGFEVIDGKRLAALLPLAT